MRSANSAMRVDARAHRRAADRQLGERARGLLQAADPVPDCGGVAREFLAQPDRHRVLQVRPADLDHLVEGLGPLGQPLVQLRERGDELLLDALEGRQVDGRGDHVVGGLAHVHRVVGMDRRPPAPRPAVAARWRFRRSPRWCSCWSRCRCRSGRHRARTGRRACPRRPPARPG